MEIWDNPAHVHAFDLAERLTLAAARGDFGAAKAIVAGVDLDDTEIRQTFGVMLSAIIGGLAHSLEEATGRPALEILERALGAVRGRDLNEE